MLGDSSIVRSGHYPDNEIPAETPRASDYAGKSGSRVMFHLPGGGVQLTVFEVRTD